MVKKGVFCRGFCGEERVLLYESGNVCGMGYLVAFWTEEAAMLEVMRNRGKGGPEDFRVFAPAILVQFSS